MADTVIPESRPAEFLPESSKAVAKENDADTCELQPLQPDEGSEFHDSFVSQMDRGHMEYGCSHYRRRCRIRAPCCNEVFYCRHCHNEAKNNLIVDPKLRHDIPRHQVQKNKRFNKFVRVVGYAWGSTFVDTASSLMMIHPKDNTTAMGVAYAELVARRISYIATNAIAYLFESTTDISVLKCGHTIHKNCLNEMQEHNKYACPICSKSVGDMSNLWENLDVVIAETPMPEEYQDKKVWILCNDCGARAEVQFHIIGHKCPNCRSYNTRQIKSYNTHQTADNK